MEQLNNLGYLKLNVAGQEIDLGKDDLLIDMAQTEGYVADSYAQITVVLETTLTPELVEEGFVREIISKVQQMRKEAGFEVMDKIAVYLEGNDKLEEIVRKNEELIKSEVLADEVGYDSVKGFTKEWNINGESVTMGVEKLS